MAQQTLNLGASADDGTGDSLRVGGGKINANFTELYGLAGDTFDGAYASLTGIPTTFTPAAHDQAASTITGLATVATTGQYGALLGIPTTFTPAAHDQAASTITGLASVATTGDYDDLLGLPALFPGNYSDLAGIPTSFTPAAHDQAISTITDLQAGLDAKAPLTPAQGTITYAATVDLDMATLNGLLRTITLTGNLTFTASNQASQRSVTLRLISGATLRTLTFPADWVFLGAKPANIAASKVGVLSLTFFGSTDADCVAAWGVQS